MNLHETLRSEFYSVFADSQQEASVIATVVVDNWSKLKNADCNVFYDIFAKNSLDSDRAHSVFYCIRDLKTSKWFVKQFML
jgi:hypothetical protein